MRRVLSLPAYRRLLLAYALNEVALSVSTLTLSYLIYRRTGSAIGATAFYLSAQFAPALFAPLVVARVDRMSPRRVLPALYGAESVIFLLLALLVGHFQLILVLALAITDGLAWMAARPLARATAVAVTAPAGLLREGNAVLNGSFSISLLLGPALAGAVVASGGTQAALLINVGLFLLMALALATAKLPMPAQSEGSSRRRVRAAAAYVRAHRPVRVLIVMQAVAVMFFTITIPVEVIYAQHSLHAGAAGYGLLLSAWGGGAVVGSLAYARWRSADTRALVVLSAASIGLGMATMAAAPNLGVALAGAALGGIGNGVESVAARTALQEQTDETWMALVMSFADSLLQLTPGLGILLGGSIAATAGPRPALAVGAGGALFIAAAAWVALGSHNAFMRPASQPPL